MREVKEKGTMRKDPRWDTPYIEKTLRYRYSSHLIFTRRWRNLISSINKMKRKD